jgi:hypothetical protein
VLALLLLHRQVVFFTLPALSGLLLLAGTLLTVVLVAATCQCREVRRTVADVLPVYLLAEVLLRLLKNGQRIASQPIDKALLVPLDVVVVMDLCQQQPRASVMRLCSLPCLARGPRQVLGVNAPPLLEGGSRHACAVLVGSQQRLDDQVSQARGHTGLA